jgi:hypothetical protein
MARETDDFSETLVIYYSVEDQRWIAHGLHTDQIGDGDSVIAAIEDALRGINAVQTIAHDDPSVEFWREAPPDIQAMAHAAQSLPREIYEIAHRRAHGRWPNDVPVDVKPDTGVSFKTEIRERQEVCC